MSFFSSRPRPSLQDQNDQNVAGPSTVRPLRVVFVGARDDGGGAARATYRIFRALWDRQEQLGLDLTMRVIEKRTNHPAVTGGPPTKSYLQKAQEFTEKRIRRLLRKKKYFSPHTIYESRAQFDTGLGREFKKIPPDLYVLNWLGSHTLSIREIGKIKKKIVWQLHDMWMFSGTEHYRFDDRAALGYSRRSRSRDEKGPDLNRQIFRLKKRHWRGTMPVIAPSTWLASEVAKSVLTKKWPVFVEAYPLDTEFWHPLDSALSKEIFEFGPTEKVVLFGAAGGTKHPHKGADLLFDAIRMLSEAGPSEKATTFVLGIFGEEGPDRFINGTKVRFLGNLDDDLMRHAYSAADVLVVPSRIENLAQVGLEGHSCGLPAVVFENTGVTDVVDHGVTGFHAKKDDPQDLARHIGNLLSNEDLRLKFGAAARERAVRLWHPDTVASRYAEILHTIARGQK